MKNELKIPFYLALQSIKRGRKWTLFLTILLMAVAFINLIFVSALFNGIVEGSNQQIKSTLTGNVYMAPKEGQTNINAKDKLLSDVKRIDGVQEVTSGFQVPARIEKGSRSGTWPVIAIDPASYAKVIDISGHMYQGKYLDSNDEDSIILGREIAGGDGVVMDSTSLKRAKVGDKVKLVFDNTEKTFIVKGIFYTKFTESDARAFITEKSFSSLMPTMANKATTINIKTLGTDESKVLTKVQQHFLKIDAFLWSEAAGLMKSVSSSFTSIDVLMTTVGVIIAAITIFIVIYVDIINRRKQIGILRAIGIGPNILISYYIILALVYATLGILLGSFIFYAVLVPYFQVHPFVLPITDAVLNLKWTEYIIRLEIVTWVAVVSGLVPAAIVTRSKMIDEILGK